MSIFSEMRKSVTLPRRGKSSDAAAAAIPVLRPERADGMEHHLRKMAWDGFISEGLVEQGYHATRAETASQRAENTVRHGDLRDQLASIDAELGALVEQPAPPPPEPRVLRSMATVLPFTKGEARHG